MQPLPLNKPPPLLSPSAKPLPSGPELQGVKPLLCRQSCSRAVGQLCSPGPSSLCRAQGWEHLPGTGGLWEGAQLAQLAQGDAVPSARLWAMQPGKELNLPTSNAIIRTLGFLLEDSP